MKSIAIIGGFGQLGKALYSVLNKSFLVRQFGREEVDIEDEESLHYFGVNHAFDYVINCAAWTDVDGCEKDAAKAYRINAYGAGNLAHNVTNSAFIHISTDYVFPGDDYYNLPGYTEYQNPAPVNVYGASKLTGEYLVRELHPDYAILRTSHIFGPTSPPRGDVVKKIWLTLASGDNEFAADPWFNVTYSLDLAQMIGAFILQRDRMNCQIYHAANNGGVSPLYIAKRVCECQDWTFNPQPGPNEERAAKRPLYTALDCRKWYKAIGYTAPDSLDAVEKFVRDYLSQFPKAD